jgi:hypothetical protein
VVTLLYSCGLVIRKKELPNLWALALFAVLTMSIRARIGQNGAWCRNLRELFGLFRTFDFALPRLRPYAGGRNGVGGKNGKRYTVVGPVGHYPPTGRGIVFWHLLQTEAPHIAHRQQASFLHNTSLGFPFPSLPCLPNQTTSHLACLSPFYNTGYQFAILGRRNCSTTHVTHPQPA